jgi:hypothetical protein
VDAGDAVVIGDLFHSAFGAAHFPGGEGFRVIGRRGVDKADVGVGQEPPGFADDAFHGVANGVGGRAGVVDGELNKEEVGFVG